MPREQLFDLSDKTTSLCVFGISPSTTKEAVIADVEAQTGVRPIFLHEPEGKQFAFVEFANAEDAKHALNKGFKIASRTVSIRYAKPVEGLDVLEGKTTSLRVFGIPLSVTVEAVIADVETQTDVRAVSFHRPEGKQFAFLEFKNAEDAKHALNKGFKIASRTVSIRYAKSIEGLSDLEGKTTSLCVFGIPPSVTVEAVVADVEAQTGVRPIFLHQPEGKEFAFLEFKNAEDAKQAFSRGFKIAGKKLSFQYAKPRRGLNDLEGKTATEEAVIADVEAKTGARPVSFHQPEGKQFAFVDLKKTCDMTNKGFKVVGRNVAGQNVKAREDQLDLEGKTASLCVFGIPPNTTEEAVMADVETQTGVRPVSVDQPDGKQFAFIHFENAEDAKHALDKGFRIAGTSLSVQYAKPKERSSDLEGKTTSLCVFGIPPSATEEAVIADVETQTGVRPILLHQPEGKQFAFLKFKNAEDAKQAFCRGFKIAGHKVSFQYAKPRRGLNDLEGKTAWLHVIGISPSATEEAVIADVEEKTGVRPVSFHQPDGKEFSFIEFKNAKDAKHALEKGFKIASRTVSVQYAKPKERLSDLEGKTSSLCVGGILPSATEQSVIADVEAQTGVRPIFLHEPEGKQFAFVEFENAEDAKHALNKGFKIASRTVSIQYAKPKEKLSDLEGKTTSLCVFGVPPSTSVEAVIAEVEAETGAKPASFHQPEGKEFAFLEFKNAEDAKQAFNKGFKIAGKKLSFQYAKPREEQLDLEGKTMSLCVAGIPRDMAKEQVLADVEAQTGIRPSLFYQPKGRQFAFLEFKNARDAKKCYHKGFMVAGRNVAIQYAKPREEQLDLEGTTTWLHVVGIPPSATEEAVIADVEAETGIRPVSFYRPEGQQFAFVEFENAEDAKHALNKGFKIAETKLTVRYGRPREEQLGLEGKVTSLCVHGIPPNTTEEAVIADVEAATGIRPVFFYRPEGKHFAFLEFENAKDAKQALKKGFEIAGRTLAIRYVKPREDQLDLEGKATSLHVVGIPMNMAEEAVIADVEAQTNIRPCLVYQPEGKQVAFIEFENAEDTTKCFRMRFKIAGRNVVIKYAKPREELLNLEGKTTSLCVFGIPPNTTKEAVLADVQAQTGVRPVSFHRPEGKQFAFIEFENADDTAKCYREGFKIGGRNVAIRYDARRTMRRERGNDWSHEQRWAGDKKKYD
jgi:RNA recognition motif-containing protein